jgi:hypothetical protein
MEIILVILSFYTGFWLKTIEFVDNIIFKLNLVLAKLFFEFQYLVMHHGNLVINQKIW